MALIAGVDVPPRDRDELQRWVRSPSMPAGMVMRARIVLAAADGWTKTADEILLHRHRRGAEAGRRSKHMMTRL
jgi:hypothetical protein